MAALDGVTKVNTTLVERTAERQPSDFVATNMRKSSDISALPSNSNKDRKETFLIARARTNTSLTSVFRELHEVNTTLVERTAERQPSDFVATNMRKSSDISALPSNSNKDRKETFLIARARTNTSLTSVFRELHEGDNIKGRATHDKITLGLIYMSVICGPLCATLSLVPMIEGTQGTHSFAQLYLERIENLMFLNSGMYLGVILYCCCLSISSYALTSTCRRNEAGGLLYCHPGFMSRVYLGMTTLLPTFLLGWAGFLAMNYKAWAFVAILGSLTCGIVGLTAVLKSFKQKKKEYPHAVSKKEKNIFRVMILNSTAFVTSRLGLLMLKTLVLLLLTEVEEMNHILASYLFYGLFSVQIVVVGVIDLNLLQYTRYLYGHFLVWTTFSLVLSVLSFREDLSTPLKVLPCILTVIAFMLFAIKSYKTFNYTMDRGKLRSVAPVR